MTPEEFAALDVRHVFAYMGNTFEVTEKKDDGTFVALGTGHVEPWHVTPDKAKDMHKIGERPWMLDYDPLG